MTLETKIKELLEKAGLEDNGDAAKEVHALVEKELETLVPTEGDMTQRQHTAFMMRAFLYLTEMSPAKNVEIDLNDMLNKTTGRLLQISLTETTFSARTVQAVIQPQKGILKNVRH